MSLKESAILLSLAPGEKVYVINKFGRKSPSNWLIERSQVSEINRKLSRSGKDLGWSIIVDGIRYKVSNFGKSWFLDYKDASQYLSSMIDKEGKYGK